MNRNIVIALAIGISIAFIILAPVVPQGWPSGMYQGSYQYDCPPGDNRIQGLPVSDTMSISYAVFKIGFIYDQQLNPPIAFDAGSTIRLPCKF